MEGLRKNNFFWGMDIVKYRGGFGFLVIYSFNSLVSFFSFVSFISFLSFFLLVLGFQGFFIKFGFNEFKVNYE